MPYRRVVAGLFTALSLAGRATAAEDCHVIEELGPPASVGRVHGLSPDRMIIAKALHNDVPIFLRQTDHGEIPVILVTHQNLERMTPYLEQSIGMQTILQANWFADHDVYRLSGTLIDLDFPNSRKTDVEFHKSGVGWKNIAGVLESRGDDDYPVIEVSYAVAPSEMQIAELYQRMRRAALIRAPFVAFYDVPGLPGLKYPGLAVEEGGNTLRWTGAEHCVAYCRGRRLSDHERQIIRTLQNEGIGDVDAFMQSESVQKFLAAARATLLAQDVWDPRQMRHALFGDKTLLAYLRPFQKGARSQYKQTVFANWVFALDTITQMRMLNERLGVSGEQGNPDMNNPRATAVLIYDKPDMAARFQDASYSSRGKRVHWLNQDQRPLPGDFQAEPLPLPEKQP